MAKKSVSGNVFGGSPKNRMSNVLAGDRTGGRMKFNQTSGMYANSPYANAPTSLGAYAKPGRSKTKDQARVGASAANKPTSVVGGLGFTAYGNSKLRAPEFRSPKNATTATRNYQYGNVMGPAPAAAPAPIKAQVKPGDVVNRAVGAVKSKAADVVRTVTNMKNSPTPKRGTNLGVTTGKVTGTSATRGGTGGRTTGGGRAAGGGYTNAGPAGPGASGRGTGGKR